MVVTRKSTKVSHGANSQGNRTGANKSSKASSSGARTKGAQKLAAPGPRAVASPLIANRPTSPRWTFLTNHAHVMILLYQDSSLVLREVATVVGITERAVQRIIADLEEDGFLQREKVGRQNHYRILLKQPLRHPIESHRTIGDLISLITAAH